MNPKPNLHNFFNCSAIIEFILVIPSFILVMNSYIRIQHCHKELEQPLELNQQSSKGTDTKLEIQVQEKEKKKLQVNKFNHLKPKINKDVVSQKTVESQKRRLELSEKHMFHLLPLYIFFIINVISFGSYTLSIITLILWLICLLLFNIFKIFHRMYTSFDRNLYLKLQGWSEQFHHLFIIIAVFNYIGNDQNKI